MRGLTLLGLLAASACVTTPTPAGVARDASPGVVLVRVFDANRTPVGLGSGFFVDDSEIITNLHVVEGASHAVARTSSGAELDVTGVVAEPRDGADAIRLSVAERGAGRTMLPLRTDLPAVGEPVVVIGAPRGLEQTVTSGIVSAIRPSHDVWGEVFQMDAAISPGSSGGPVLDADGEVVGITVGTRTDAQGVNYAIPSRRLERMVRGVPISLSRWTERRKDAARREATAAISRGRVAFEARRYADALRAFEQARRLDPHSLDAVVWAAHSCLRLKVWQRAVEYYAVAIRIAPGVWEHYHNMGVAFHNLGRHHDAIEWYVRALDRNENSLTTVENLGLAYFKLRRYPDAINAFREVLRSDASRANARYHLALALRHSGATIEAWQHLLTLRLQNPALADALHRELLKVGVRDP